MECRKYVWSGFNFFFQSAETCQDAQCYCCSHSCFRLKRTISLRPRRQQAVFFNPFAWLLVELQEKKMQSLLVITVRLTTNCQLQNAPGASISHRPLLKWLVALFLQNRNSWEKFCCYPNAYMTPAYSTTWLVSCIGQPYRNFCMNYFEAERSLLELSELKQCPVWLVVLGKA